VIIADARLRLAMASGEVTDVVTDRHTS